MARELAFFADVQTELEAADSLHVLARGLGQYTALANFIVSAVSPGSLLLCLNVTRPLAQAVLWPQLQSIAPPDTAALLLPRFLSADYSVRDRAAVYASSGLVLVTPTVLVHDLLHDTLPAARVRGVLLASADGVRERSNLHFALTLFRARNRTAFVKAVCEAPHALARGCHTAERQLRMLYLSRLVLWPRFHRAVRDALRPHAPDLVDLAVPLARGQAALLAALRNVVHAVLHDVRSAVRTLDLSDVFHETACEVGGARGHEEGAGGDEAGADAPTRKTLAPNFDDIVRRQVDPASLPDHAASSAADPHASTSAAPSPRVRTLLADLSVLRGLLRDAFELDCVAFYQRVVTLRHTAPRAHSWLMRREAQPAVRHARARVWTPVPRPVAPTKQAPVAAGGIGNGGGAAAATGRPPAGPDAGPATAAAGSATAPAAPGTGAEEVIATLEPSPKWAALRDVLAEIRADTRTAGPDADVCRVVVAVRSARVADEVRAVLAHGADAFLEAQFRAVFPSVARRARARDAPGGAVQTTLTQLARRGESPEADAPGVARPGPQAVSRRDAWVERRDARRELRARRGDGAQAVPLNACGEAEQAAAVRELQRTFREVRAERVVEPEVLVWACEWTETCGRLQRVLSEYGPSFVVLYHAELALVRQVELYRAASPGRAVRLYVLSFDDAADEERLRAAAEREKSAFKTLIRERATMSLHDNQEGREDDTAAFTQHVLGPEPPSRRGLGSDRDSRVSGARARRARRAFGGDGGPQQAQAQAQAQSCVLVDTRELRSALPMLLHQTGVHIVPLTLEVADFVLSREIGVERKSVPDLHGSFASGRLFKQAEALTRHYKHACLLIELGARRPLSLSAVSGGVPHDLLATHVVSKMVLLVQQFPTLRMLWACGPHDAAALFKAVKAADPEPDEQAAAACGVDAADQGDDRWNAGPRALLRSLPGIDSHNLERVMRRVRNVATLVTMGLDELSALLGSAVKARRLHDFVNEQPSEALAAL